MKKVTSRRIVIDASVVRAAGISENPISSACRRVLLAVLHICHQVVVTDAIREEWRHHASRFTRKWKVSMAARKKPIQTITPAIINIDNPMLSEVEQRDIDKDICLLQAAFSADHIVVTLDDAFRTALIKTSQGRKIAARIRWVHPLRDGEKALEKL